MPARACAAGSPGAVPGRRPRARARARRCAQAGVPGRDRGGRPPQEEVRSAEACGAADRVGSAGRAACPERRTGPRRPPRPEPPRRPREGGVEARPVERPAGLPVEDRPPRGVHPHAPLLEEGAHQLDEGVREERPRLGRGELGATPTAVPPPVRERAHEPQRRSERADDPGDLDPRAPRPGRPNRVEVELPAPGGPVDGHQRGGHGSAPDQKVSDTRWSTRPTGV
jgi:hypothetical protein